MGKSKRIQVVNAFTSDYPTLVGVLKNKIGMCAVGDDDNSVKTYIGLWDTGATGTCITPKVVKELGLKASGKRNICGADGDLKDPADTYFVKILLPNNLFINQVNVSELKNLKGCDILIGMDIILLGDFAVSSYGKKTSFSFRFPSVEKTDYTQPRNQLNKAHKIKLGRNSQCSCGSGKKNKHCCRKK